MFVRSKDPNGENVTMLAYKIAAFFETKLQKETEGKPAEGDTPAVEATVEEISATIVCMDSGQSFTVVDSERVIRSKILKAGEAEAAPQE
jgi:hypothetical protein